MSQMNAVIVRQIYQAEDFNVLLCKCKSHSSECPQAVDEAGKDLYGKEFKILSKNSLPSSSTSIWTLEGQWDSKHQLNLSQIAGANGCSCNHFQDNFELMSELKIPAKTSLKILKFFGDKCFQVVLDQPKELQKAKLTSDEILFVYQTCEKYSSYIFSLLFLRKFDFGKDIAKAVVRTFREKSIFILENHPYDLCIRNILSFNDCEKIANFCKIPCLTKDKMKASIISVITKAERQGAMCIRMDCFQKELSAYSWDEVQKEMQNLLEQKIIWVSKDPFKERGTSLSDYWIYRYDLASIENSISKSVCRLNHNPVRGIENIDVKIQEAEDVFHCTLAKEQKEGIKTIFKSPFSILTGGPGTGKTTLTKIVCYLFEKFIDRKILLCAPTGCAASKMSMATGREASTIHHVLGLRETKSNISIEGKNRIESSLLIIDEASMLDCYVAEVLFKSISEKTQVIIIGDVDQLPSIRSGNILKSLIDSNIAPVIRLQTVFRQKQQSLISVNRDKIKRKDSALIYGNDFQFINACDMQTAQNQISSIYMEEVRYFGLENVIALTPYRKKTLAGVNELNKRLRELINPSRGESLKCGGKIFRKGDRIMALDNTPDYCNGDIGFITDIRKEGKQYFAVINFENGKPITIEAKTLSKMDLCYATTIHKSQGAEFGTVIICVMKEYENMLDRSMLYTAVTRARNRVIMVGNQKTLSRAICKEPPSRPSLLSQRLMYTK